MLIKTQRKLTLVVAGLSLLGAASSAQATHIEYFGEDLGQGEDVRLASTPNADQARNDFFSNLLGVGTEDLESFSTNTGAPLSIAFPGAGITATLQGTGFIETVPTGTNGVGRYPISGDNYWETGQTFFIEFDNPVAAFGFYGVDIGDFGGQVTATLSNGSSEVYNIPNTINGLGGGVLYWGIVEKDDTYTRLDFGNTAAGTDFFGFDDFSVGSPEQVSSIPEPATLVLMSLGLAGLGFSRKRKAT